MEIDSTLVEIDSKMELIEGNGSNYSKTFHNINEQEIPISSTIAVELEKVAATYSITFTVTKRSSKGCQKKKKKKKILEFLLFGGHCSSTLRLLLKCFSCFLEFIS